MKQMLPCDMVRERYEELRAYATSGSHFAQGQREASLLLARGMPEWMHVWSYVLPPERAPAARGNIEKAGSPGDAARTQAVMLLARMAIAASKEGAAC